ncbi:MAG: hypothetical protein GC208_10655 [Alphaproteobacteria bacterium]|nr:hypothetical protein [Alphaproteobacteria bacterium]
MKRFGIMAVFALSACATTTGDTTYQAEQDAGRVTGINEDGERVRCERVRETGSRFTQRVCHTEHEWELIEENARQAAQDSQARYPRDCGPTPENPVPDC